jgi:hypothetical protein
MDLTALTFQHAGQARPPPEERSEPRVCKRCPQAPLIQKPRDVLRQMPETA